MHFLYYNLLDAEILKWLRKITANGLALGAFAAKANLSTFGKINILREETLDLS